MICVYLLGMERQSKWQRVWEETGQLDLFASRGSRPEIIPFQSMLIWNICRPAKERAASQLDWLKRQNASVIVLTETAQNEGCELLQRGLTESGYRVVASLPEGREYGTIIASKCGGEPSEFADNLPYLPYRAASMSLEVEPLEIIGVYIPSRSGTHSLNSDITDDKIDRKRDFLSSFLETLALDNTTPRIICGDFNVVPRNHLPTQPLFQDWEYGFLESLEKMGYVDAFLLHDPERQDHSWFGHDGNKQRLDYCFIPKSLASRMADASFDHIPRQIKLSDHSVLKVIFNELI